MGLFGNGTDKAQMKQQQEIQNFINKYQLNTINEQDLVIIRRIVADMAGTGALKTGMALSFAKAEEQAKVSYLSAIFEQNWMIIRKLDEISQRLAK